MDIKCVPHCKPIEWVVENVSTDFNTNIMSIDIIGKRIVDYINIEFEVI